MFEKRTLIGSSILPIRFVFFMWLLFALEFVYGFDLSLFGIIPRNIYGLIGVITSPYIHAGPIHLISNTFPLLFLSITLFYNYPRIARPVFYGCYLITNLLVWLLGRPYPHIGASGLVYGLATFAILFGLLRRDVRSIMISGVVLLLYGSIYYGVLPGDERVSWESHLFGTIVGMILAGYYSQEKKV
ncbi:rhomboid family intramembrane serine protease [Fulvivirga lutea]|nr:rhomboid family intramembrane serine protease [Fulvivirga lutea]